MTVLATFLLALAGFAALALSMQKHHRDVLGRASPRSRELLFGSGGWLLLAVSLFSAIAGADLFVGIVLWLGLVTIAALAVAMVLTYGPRNRA